MTLERCGAGLHIHIRCDLAGDMQRALNFVIRGYHGEFFRGVDNDGFRLDFSDPILAQNDAVTFQMV
ncbi:hypothetical protein D3C79_1029040 [compost metagenome]